MEINLDRSDAPIDRIRPEDPGEKVRVLGWAVRSEGQEGSDAYFPDATYGGREEAYRAAKAWYVTAGEEKEEDTVNIDRIVRGPDRKDVWELRWMIPDPGTGEEQDREFFSAEEYGSVQEAFEQAVARLREVKDTRSLLAEDPDELALEIEDEEATLREADDILAVARYKRRAGRRAETKGYRVRIRRQNEVHTKFFSDANLGGRKGALRAAQYWRDVKKGEMPRGAERPVPEELTLEDEADRYLRAAIERSQFGVPRMSVELRTMDSGNEIPYVKASWPVEGGRSKDKYVSLEDTDIEEATEEICRVLVQARRASALTPEEMGNRATPFDVVDGWFADKSDTSPEEEARELYEAVLPGVKKRAHEVLAEWRRRKKGIPGLDVRVRKNESGRYAPFLRARWKDPSGDEHMIEEEILDGDVEAALERLAEALLLYYQDYSEKWKLRHDERSPFSVLEASSRTPGERVTHMVEIGRPAATLQYKEVKQGLTGISLKMQDEHPEKASSSEQGGRPQKRCTLYLTWPTASSMRRRQKSFDDMSELRKALATVVRRALKKIRSSKPKDLQPAVGQGSPFQGIKLREIQDEEGLERVTRRIVRRELPTLRLEYERLTEEADQGGSTAAGSSSVVGA